MITIGSLFDGISGFPLAGQRNGMTALWASEIEPFPMKVSAIRFPDMVQHGDITKINGAEVEPVDIITGGSPCQDLSVAGKRAGLAGERSGLFMEMVRVVREMREHEKRNGRTGVDIRPRFMVWENVPGAFSSNKGEDFRAVLEETARIADETAVIPGPPKGKWNTAGCIMGNGWSIAWRVLDAQYWGVPQRRRRIYLVADFGGQSAPEVLFKRKGLSRHIAESREAREGITADVEGSIGKAIAIDSNCQDSRFKLTGGVVPTLPAKAGTGGNNGPSVAVLPFDTTQITSPQNGNNPKYGDPCHPLAAGAHPPAAVINCEPSGIAGTVSSKWAKGTGGPAGDEHYNLVVDEVAKPLSAQPQLKHLEDMDTLITQRYSVRRLTPLECERLQDFPDGWTDIPGASDSARYKALGNSIAVCCAEYVLEGIKEAINQ